jgi:hypothetical protein
MSLTVAILAASAWASGWRRYTWGARFGTFGCALAVLGIGVLWQRGRRGGRPLIGEGGERLPAVNRAGAALWLAVILVAAVWDVLGLLTPPDRHHLTLSAMELAYRPLHALMFACWLGIGWVLAREPLRRHGR